MWVTSQKNEGTYTKIAAHDTLPIIAIAHSDGTVTGLDEDGNILDGVTYKKDTPPNHMTWHPAKKFLAASYDDGTVALWCIDSQISLREGKYHQNKVTSISWSPLGTRLITGDADGNVIVGKVDSRGRLSSMAKYRLSAEVINCTFRPTPVTANDPIRLKESASFFLSTSTGQVYFADDMGHCTECFSTTAPVHALYASPEGDSITVLTKDLTLSRYSITLDGKIAPEESVKLSGGLNSMGANIHAIWMRKDLLATSVNGSPVKIWDATNEETSILEKSDLNVSEWQYIAYNERNRLLSVGSKSGYVVIWSPNRNITSSGATSWEPITKIDVSGAVCDISWGANGKVLVVQTADSVQVIADQSFISMAHFDSLQLTQINPTTIQVQKGLKPGLMTINNAAKIKSYECSSESVAILSGSSLKVYRLDDPLEPQFLSNIPCETSLYKIDSKFVYVANEHKVDIYSHQGALKQSIFIDIVDGSLEMMLESNGNLSLLTNKKTLKVFDVSGKDPKLTMTRNISSKLKAGHIYLWTANSSGSHMALATTANFSQVLVFNVEDDEILTYDVPSSTVTGLFWDKEDPRVLVCEASTFNDNLSSASKHLHSLYVSREIKIATKDILPVPEGMEKLVSIALPNHVFFKKPRVGLDVGPPFALLPIKEYSGLDMTNTSTTSISIKAITDFCVNLSSGKVDQALKSVKLIKNELVYENMARMCIKTRKISLAKYCLGRVRNAKTLRTVGDVEEASEEVQAIQLAMHLGLYDDALTMCKETGQFQLMSDIHESIGKWEKALETSAANDRQSLPSSFFKYARYLEEIGDAPGAIAAYEKSNTHRVQVPRMLLKQSEELQKYVDTTNDPAIKKWWAQNAESHGDLEVALKYYSLANDVLSMARVHCLSGNVSHALQIAQQNEDNLAVAFHLARHFEEHSQIREAIQYYEKAKCINPAIRLAKTHNIDGDLMRLALQSSKTVMMEVASYFAEQVKKSNGGNLDKAITLFHKAGCVSKAIEMCCQVGDVALLETVALSLDPAKDARAIDQAARFLIQNGATERAIRLLFQAKRFKEALAICEKANISLPEETLESLDFGASGISESDSKALNVKLGDLCMMQKQYQLACKRYTLGGERMKAMNALLKSGDKEKILFYANVSGGKMPEIYVMAANYLQSLDWRSDPTVMKSIIQFYAKAKHYSGLARFYESSANTEIDEYQNYEKALAALKEVDKCLQKSSHPDLTSKTSLYRRRIELISLFLDARRASENGHIDHVEKMCGSLLSEPDIDASVRVGDILGLLVETFYSTGDREKAMQYLSQLQHQLPNTSPDFYVQEHIISDLRPDRHGHIGEDEDEHVPRDGIEEVIQARSAATSRLSQYHEGGVHSRRRQVSHTSEKSVPSQYDDHDPEE